jgi:hypothetical protein
MKKGVLIILLFTCKIFLHAQMFMPPIQPANHNSSFNKTISSIEVLAVGAGGGGGGSDGGAIGTGGGSGAAVYTKINSFTGNVLTIAIGGGGGGGATNQTGTGGGTGGANGGGAGGAAGGAGYSGSGGGGGGWSGVYSGSIYYIVAGGGAGGGGGGEGVANERGARGGGTQTNGANGTSMSGGAGANYSGDGGGGGGGGGGWYGGNGQNPNSATNDYNSSGGGNYTHPSFTSGTVTNVGNNGVASAVTAGAATTATNAALFNYSNNRGGGGSANGNVGTGGIVIIRYPGTQMASGGVYSFVNGFSIHTFTSNGTLSFVMLPVKGAMAHYMASEFASGVNPTTWTDQTGNGYNATMSGITTVMNSTLKNNVVLQGTNTSSVIFPVFSNHNWTTNSKYTLFVVERYTSTSASLQKRIITDYSSGNNWLTGHWMTHVGVSHHNGWLTDVPNGITATVAGGTDWILYTDQNSYARTNGTEVSKYAPGSPSGFSQIGINTPGWSGEKSNFEMAEFIIYPRELNRQEINFVETYLINKYGIAGSNDGLMLNLDAANKQSFDGNGTIWTDLVSANQIQWSSSLAPQFKIVDGVSTFVTTPTIGTTRSILSSGYTNLREGNGAYSVMAIFKPNSLTAYQMLVSMGPASSLCDGSIIHPIGLGAGGKFAGGACGGLGTWSLNTGVTPTTDRFWCVTTTFTGGTNGTETVYVNGAFDKSATMTTNTPVNSINRFNVGWMRDGEPNLNMDANVAVILYYNKALSAAEVLALYNKYKKRFNLNLP